MSKPIHICLISVEIFAWGKYGGFGRATRMIGRELVKRGFQVSAIIPRRKDQRAEEDLDGIRVLSFQANNLRQMLSLYKQTTADIYHSQEPSFGSYLAQYYHSEKCHLITCRDTRLWQDWLTELSLPSLNKLQVLSNWMYEDNPLVHHAIRHADGVFVAANLLQERAKRKYHLSELPVFLPTPVEIPFRIVKDETPTVCFISRLDRRKQPEKFFNLAEKFPEIHFIAAGYSRDPSWQAKITEKYSLSPNIEIVGFINQFEKGAFTDLLSRSWILVNTAAREGLPNSFIEAAAHKTAILSAVNPDDFAASFGYHVQDDNFANGLNRLLEDHLWQHQAEKGYQYVIHNFDVNVAMNQHVDIYQRCLAKKGKS